MTQIHDLDRRIDLWLDEVAAPRLPDYTDRLLARTKQTRQQRALWYRWRWIPMPDQAAPRPVVLQIAWLLVLAALAVALGAAIAIGAGLLRLEPPPSDGLPLSWARARVVDARPADVPRGCIPDPANPAVCYPADPGMVDMTVFTRGVVGVGNEGGAAGAGHPVAWLSTDGRTWELVRIDLGEPLPLLENIYAAADGSLVATGRYQGLSPGEPDGQPLWRSTDGRTWTPLPPLRVDPVLSLGDIARAGDRYIAVFWEEWQVELWQSPDGLSWSELPIPEDLASGATLRYVAASDAGIVLSLCPASFDEVPGDCFTAASADGTTWATSNPLPRPLHVAWHAGRWVAAAVPESDKPIPRFESDDGTRWRAVGAIPGTECCQDVGPIHSVGGRLFVSTIAFSRTWTTSDGRTWEEVETGVGPPGDILSLGETVVMAEQWEEGLSLWYGTPTPSPSARSNP